MTTGIRQREVSAELIDLGAGQPDESLLPVAAWTAAASAGWVSAGPATLEYGANAGPLPLRQWLAARLGCAVDELVITAGASHALQLLAATLGQRGIAVTEQHSYRLGMDILRSEGLDIVGVAQDESGICTDVLDETLGRLASEGTPANVIYIQALFQNPTGSCMPLARQREVVAVGRRHGAAVIVDDAYRELAFTEDGSGEIARDPSADVRVGTLAKSVGPGIRLGWIQTSADLARQLANHPLLVSGGGIAHLASLAMARFAESGAYERHLRDARSAYRARATTLIDAVASVGLPHPEIEPRGGFFLWQPLPGLVATGTLEHALRSRGLVAVPSDRFAVEPAGVSDHVRLAFARQQPESLVEAAHRLGAAIDDTRRGG